MKKVLIVPPMPWYLEIHAEYLIRHLSNEFLIEVADVPYPPYDNFLNRFPETNPFQRNPDDYDLIWPLLPTHWVVTEKDKYAHKVATVFYQPNEGRTDGVAVVGATTPLAEKSLQGKEFFSLRFGIDAEMFKPLGFKKEGKMKVGMVGGLLNPRRMVADVINTIGDLDGVELMLFMNKAPASDHDMDFIGGKKNMKYIVTGNKSWPGLANIYNRLDVLLRCDSDPGYSFPVLEAASCGVPVIATDSGIDHLITQAGGGWLIEGNRDFYLNHVPETMDQVKRAVIWMRDNPMARLMLGRKAREEILENWTWDKHIGNWRRFFRMGIDNASKI